MQRGKSLKQLSEPMTPKEIAAAIGVGRYLVIVVIAP
jgi:hypothetical protein